MEEGIDLPMMTTMKMKMKMTTKTAKTTRVAALTVRFVFASTWSYLVWRWRRRGFLMLSVGFLLSRLYFYLFLPFRTLL